VGDVGTMDPVLWREFLRFRAQYVPSDASDGETGPNNVGGKEEDTNDAAQ